MKFYKLLKIYLPGAGRCSIWWDIGGIEGESGETEGIIFLLERPYFTTFKRHMSFRVEDWTHCIIILYFNVGLSA